MDGAGKKTGHRATLDRLNAAEAEVLKTRKPEAPAVAAADRTQVESSSSRTAHHITECPPSKSAYHYDCANWWSLSFNAPSSHHYQPGLNEPHTCTSTWGFANKIGQTDCDRYFWFAGMNLQRPGYANYEWRHLQGQTGQVDAVAGWNPWPMHNFTFYNNVYAVQKVVLIGAGRVWFGGGGATVAKYLLLRNVLLPLP